jgi:Fe2+ transport system protein B
MSTNCASGDVREAMEDPERLPDGVPHAVVGLTALYAVMLAVFLMVVLVGGRFAIAIAVAFAAVPLTVFKLGHKAERERDFVHPSR